MSEDAEIKNVIPPYYGLIIDKLNRIFFLWDEVQDEIAALQCAIRLVLFLPRKLKKQLETQTTEIQKELDKASNGVGYNLIVANQRINNATSFVAHKHLAKYVNTITNLLDQEHMLTQSYGIPTRARSMGDIQKTVDIARYQSGAE